ncbi:actin-related protein 8-like isoform X1 [Cynara cardunculus var. scolymus]|uniref:actin-related protein 8-like isoform X1 n=1 Tax=Cynara cardunculus var. scolymus TaxID=59895 RepID=UPI000D62585B|nr:actin-related protein 8-like isoform X1 [Cynara cardunculus var. scolymus]XP_024989009.1 actin-related protein 8-like isoform X1 [Cynara cardunculus var. scolymus]
MSQLLKRVREWVFNGWITSGSTSDQTIVCSSSTGEVHRLPLDIFMQILKLLGPKDAARLAAVCKSWKLMVYDNTLWLYFLKNQEDGVSIFFAETKLRYFPLRQYHRRMLSFMHIYGERAQATGAIIIDVGAGYCKIGSSKYDSPSLRLRTWEFGNPRSPLTARVHHFCETVYRRMHVKPSMQPVILTTPIGFYPGPGTEAASSQQLRDAVFSALIRIRVPSVCTVNQETLALFASRRTSGILVNIGYHKTQVFPILHGYTRHEVVSVRVGGSDLTRYLWRQLLQRNVYVPSLKSVSSLKENLCYVALDYEAELQKDTEASYQVGSEGWYTLKQERFQTGEVLFLPHIAGRRFMGLHQAVGHCIECQAKRSTGDHNWYKTIVLAGGTARLPGLAERLDKELHDLLPPNISHGIRVIQSPYGADAAWHGAKMFGNLSSFRTSWCL